ncbi:zinc finger, CCHC-type containing protein, partial [Tanacetum coccineum]
MPTFCKQNKDEISRYDNSRRKLRNHGLFYRLSFFPRTHVNEESIYRRASTYPSQLRIPAGGGTTNGLFALLTSIGRSLSATISILDLISKCKVELLFMIVPIEASYQLAHTGLKVADEHQITIKDQSFHRNLMKFAVDKYLSLIIITTYRLKGSINPLLKEADIDKDGKMSMYEFRSLLRSLIEHHTVASFDYSVDLLEERVKSFSSQRVSHNVKTLLLGPYMPAGPPNGSHKPSLHPALGAAGYRQVKVLEFFDCLGLRQGVEDLRELLHK